MPGESTACCLPAIREALGHAHVHGRKRRRDEGDVRSLGDLAPCLTGASIERFLTSGSESAPSSCPSPISRQDSGSGIDSDDSSHGLPMWNERVLNKPTSSSSSSSVLSCSSSASRVTVPRTDRHTAWDCPPWPCRWTSGAGAHDQTPAGRGPESAPSAGGAQVSVIDSADLTAVHALLQLQSCIV